jgi:hypothetical protein
MVAPSVLFKNLGPPGREGGARVFLRAQLNTTVGSSRAEWYLGPLCNTSVETPPLLRYDKGLVWVQVLGREDAAAAGCSTVHRSAAMVRFATGRSCN